MSHGLVIEVRKIHTTNLLDLAEAVSCGGDERRTGKVEIGAVEADGNL